jgi:hypothetical protein
MVVMVRLADALLCGVMYVHLEFAVYGKTELCMAKQSDYRTTQNI